ncbi:EI24 domain-containing protein [Streptomyces clavuligerus]|uniref:Integral membrane protein n=1 Tax=Streptomyces clavuligerus TaxID=1901 RepID=B5GQL1_STRCL|nr:EI24 domain-containing protein [Streptomyces clavuligerus]ANW20346.1 hypothetical protein BB341_20100 [Streptomyces clavuligerus]AXU14972.1 hypothetical protein D1794_20925 [Streptomyces clavuligerus]EDY48607.1 integral membrane protein [Streptomyces clavuligerus]EFG06708.1 Integral membrane protein [Streptomyces clavuligerus]MBY6305021.1 EI24 domain-containing protein [Streptomyces clavuligerus]
MRDLGVGFGYVMKGQRWVGTHGRWFGFGLLPGLVTLVLYGAVLLGLLHGGTDLVAWSTGFADDWSSPWLGLFRGFLLALLWILALFLSVITFTAVTLLVGQPFYESLSEQVDRSESGHAPESGRPFWTDLWISARDSLRIVIRVGLYGVLLFAAGFIPVVGQTVVPVLGFCVTGYFLTEELAAIALQRRGVDLKERLRLLRGRRLLTLGFGVPLAGAFLIPFVAVLLMPGAVAGATMMARELVPDEEVRGPGAPVPGGNPPEALGSAPGSPYASGDHGKGHDHGHGRGHGSGHGPVAGNPYAGG